MCQLITPAGSIALPEGRPIFQSLGQPEILMATRRGLERKEGNSWVVISLTYRPVAEDHLRIKAAPSQNKSPANWVSSLLPKLTPRKKRASSGNHSDRK